VNPVLNEAWWVASYENLHELMTINTAIVIGRGTPENGGNPDIRMPHDYQIVTRLILHNGVVQSSIDISQQAASIRRQLNDISEECRRKFSFPLYLFADYKAEQIKDLLDQSRSLIHELGAEKDDDS
jgi:hypothetical protein